MGKRTNKLYYNRTNTCDRCGKDLASRHPMREYDKKGNWIGNWLCTRCYDKEYRPSDFRIGNLDPNSSVGLGYIFQQITCKTRGVKDLNIENDNFHSPIDHSIDPEYGTIQTKGAIYDPKERYWTINWSNEYDKEFDYLIFYCMDKDKKNIERVYIFPKEEIIKRPKVTIYKYSKSGWYYPYRVDESPYNDTYHSMKLDDCPILRRNKNG